MVLGNSGFTSGKQLNQIAGSGGTELLDDVASLADGGMVTVHAKSAQRVEASLLRLGSQSRVDRACPVIGHGS